MIRDPIFVIREY